MYSTKIISIRNQTWELLPEKAVFWQEKSMLILTDLHLGKSGHFRKSGIAAPAAINQKNLARLTLLIEQHAPESVLVLGDLFHSNANREWFEFEEWLRQYRDIDFILVSGNHDRLHKSFYNAAHLTQLSEMSAGPFHFVHDNYRSDPRLEEMTIVSGHVHPAVKISGKGRQVFRLPAFMISRKRVLLPAFGEFTGLHTVTPEESDRVFITADSKVIEL